MYPFSEPVRTTLLWLLPAVLALLALGVPLVARSGTRAARGGHGAALALVTLLGFLVWTNGNWQGRRYFNPYEFFHYYVGAKYFPELGYTRLYDAAVLVDKETGFAHESREIANLSAHLGGREFKRLSQAWGEAEAIRAPFTAERWAEFTRDVVFFRDEMGRGTWEQLLRDKGYNPTPVWTLVGRRLSEAVPIESRAGRLFLVALDPLCFFALLACVGWAFGWRAAGFAAAFYLTHYCTSHAHFRAAFLRLDWLLALVASLCCLKKERPFLAGALLAWAGLLRVFPVLFALGPAAVCLAALLRRGDERRAPALRFVAGGLLVGALLFGASWLDSGRAAWSEFAAKIVEHDQRPASDTIGFKKLFLWTIDYGKDQAAELRTAFEARRGSWFLVQGLVAVGLGWLAWRRRLHEALALSFVFLWSFAAPAYYYYALLLVPLLYFAEEAGRWRRALGLALVFATGVFARAVHGGRTFDGHFAFKLSAAMGVLAAALWIVFQLDGRARRRSDGTDTPAGPA